jgi:hypothetical protein
MTQQEPQTVLNTTDEAETLALIEDLAGLPPLEYDRRRKEAASQLGVRLYPYHLQKPSCLRHPVIF